LPRSVRDGPPTPLAGPGRSAAGPLRYRAKSQSAASKAAPLAIVLQAARGSAWLRPEDGQEQPLDHRLRSVAPVWTYPGRVTLFRATEPWKEDGCDPHLGRDAIPAGGVEAYEVPGDHFTLLEEPHIQTLAPQLKSCLDRTQADSL
jgi:thioesterase domain-containing protein